jgi:hypothetical protein
VFRLRVRVDEHFVPDVMGRCAWCLLSERCEYASFYNSIINVLPLRDIQRKHVVGEHMGIIGQLMITLV